MEQCYIFFCSYRIIYICIYIYIYYNAQSFVFHSHNSSGRTMSLGSTQPVTETFTSVVSCGYKRPVHRTDNISIFMCRFSRNSGSVNLEKPFGPSQARIGIALLQLVIYVKRHPLCKQCKHIFQLGNQNPACMSRFYTLHSSHINNGALYSGVMQ